MLIRVVLAEDNLIFRAGVLRFLEDESDIEVVAVCEDLPGLLEVVEACAPDVVLTDIRMPPGGSDEGIQAAELWRTSKPSLGVVVLSHYAQPEYALALLSHGSRGRGYLLKDRVARGDQLGAALRAVAGGGSFIDPDVVSSLVEAQLARASPLASLTPRERDILSLIARGWNNAAIAASAVISERAVEKHINAIFSKLGLTPDAEVHRRVKAVLLFLSDR